MERKPNGKFFVLEQADCENYLTTTERNILKEIQKKIMASRYLDGKPMNGNYIVTDKADKENKELEKLFIELGKVMKI